MDFIHHLRDTEPLPVEDVPTLTEWWAFWDARPEILLEPAINQMGGTIGLVMTSIGALINIVTFTYPFWIANRIFWPQDWALWVIQIGLSVFVAWGWL